jgi:hypothetical protein
MWLYQHLWLRGWVRVGECEPYNLYQVPGEGAVAVSKGRKVPDPPIDHAAQLRDRLGRAAYTQWQREMGQLPDWGQLSTPERVSWKAIGQAVMDVIVDKGDRRGEFSVSSIYGCATQKPYVNIEVSTSPMQCSPAKAREMALFLLECADASESDAVLIGYAKDVLDLDERGAAQLLQQFRQYREKQRGSAVDSA